MPEAVIIGVGNILLKDEGVGIYAAKYIDENFLFSPSIDIIDGGTIGYRLINYLQGYDKVFILDTISADDEPGSIYSMPSEALMGMGHYRRTAHEVEVVEMLEICSLTETMAEVNVIGIVPEDIKNVGIDLTDKLKNHFDAFVGTAINELKKAGFKARRKRNKRSLDAIIQAYNLPHAQRPSARREVSEQLI
ncbi:MAG: hydrogenase expression/formation protein [bacterium]|nr:MAG: hydrogenase expression/formation protein [bacterium]